MTGHEAEILREALEWIYAEPEDAMKVQGRAKAVGDWRILEGDCRDVLASLPAGSVHTVVTSPPYFGLRDYGTGEWEGGDAACNHRHETAHQQQGATSLRAGRSNVEAQRNENFRETCGRCGARRVDRQIGLEPTPDEFVAALVAVFREVRRVLRDDGTVWLNLGDSYAVNGGARAYGSTDGATGRADAPGNLRRAPNGYKPKDLIGIPWLVAFALRADGWHLRSDIIWSKPNPMPESVTDRPTKAHEYVFLLSKGPRYFYDADAIREEHADSNGARLTALQRHGDGAVGEWVPGSTQEDDPHRSQLDHRGLPGVGTTFGKFNSAGRNKRSVWTVATQPYAGAHFATFPPKLIEPCILAGAPEGGTVLDPFAGAGTTGMVALRHNRSFVGVELNPEYAEMARDRIETAVRLGFRSPQNGTGPIVGQLELLGEGTA